MSVHHPLERARLQPPPEEARSMSEATRVDLLLVIGYFRSATPFLSVIRHLSKELRIGVIFVDLNSSTRTKTGEAHEVFVDLCRRFGAQFFALGDRVDARLMVVQQYVYSGDVVARLRESVHATTTTGMMTLAAAGLEPHDRFIEQFGITRAYAPDADLSRFLLQRRAGTKRYAQVELVDVGLPFRRYPVFPEFQVDWLFVAPTLFSFTSEAGKKNFLRTVLEVLEKIPSSDRIAYKPHNGNAVDYFAPRLYYTIGRALVRMHVARQMLEWLAACAPKAVSRKLDKLLASMLHLQILERAVPMREITGNADISVEAFMPGVRKGMIGGLSNVIWGARYFGLPFLNCIDPQHRQGVSEIKPGAPILLDINLEFFGVPYCEGRLTPPVGLPGKPTTGSVDEADFLHELRKDLT